MHIHSHGSSTSKIQGTRLKGLHVNGVHSSQDFFSSEFSNSHLLSEIRRFKFLLESSCGESSFCCQHRLGSPQLVADDEEQVLHQPI